MCARVLRGWQRHITGRRRGASPCAVGRVPSACLRLHSPRLPAAGGGKGVNLDAAGWAARGCQCRQPRLGLLPLMDVPIDRGAVAPTPCMTVLCQNGCCSWHLPESLFFFPEALNVSTPILAHLPADTPAHGPSHTFPQAVQDITMQRGTTTKGIVEEMNCNTLRP